MRVVVVLLIGLMVSVGHETYRAWHFYREVRNTRERQPKRIIDRSVREFAYKVAMLLHITFILLLIKEYS